MVSPTRLGDLSLSGLAHRCAQETNRFFNRQGYDPAYCHELFRRAAMENDQNAHTALYHQYQPLVAGWIERHPSFPGTDEEVQYFVNRAFEKFWHALSPTKFQRFNDLGALLRYLKLCTHSTIIDHGRRRRLVIVDDDPLDTLTTQPLAPDNTEADTIQQADQEQFWRLIESRLHDERERVVIHGSFVLAMKPRELHARYSSLFEDVQEIYRTKQNVLERLRRDQEFRAILGQVP